MASSFTARPRSWGLGGGLYQKYENRVYPNGRKSLILIFDLVWSKVVSVILKRFPLFVSGSAMGAVIDYVVTLTASDFLHLQPAAALALAMIISGSVVFLFHVRVTFKYSTEKLLYRYILFMGWTGLIFLLRAVLLQVFLQLGLRLAIALVIAIGLVSIVNFAISSIVIFAKTPS